MIKIYLTSEYDRIATRQKSKEMAKLLGFDIHEQVRIATAVSESIRISLNYLGEGQVQFFLGENSNKPMFMIKVNGYEIANLKGNKNLKEDKNYKLRLKSAIKSAESLIDKFQIEDIPGEGRTVLLGKYLPKASLDMTKEEFNEIIETINDKEPQNQLEYIRQQNQEILNTIIELKKKQEEINELNRELQETNKEVVALSHQLELKAEILMQSNEVKKIALRSVSHELKTPIHSILGIVGLLLGRIDGELCEEQEKQVLFINKAAEELLNMVSDLLDISKIEAGKIMIKPIEIEIDEIFSAQRGMFKSLNINHNVKLIFEFPENIPILYIDERKLSQIIRNFISNALKFTEKGQVKVAAKLSEDEKKLNIFVSDTGIGIAKEKQELIFTEFAQIDNHIQRRLDGTGLGLPLSKKFAKMIGADITVQSQLGVGSTFAITIPITYSEKKDNTYGKTDLNYIHNNETKENKILLIDDDKSFHYLLQKTLNDKGYSIVDASCGSEGISFAINEKPTIILLDWLMPDLSGYEVLEILKSNSLTENIPVIIVTSSIITESEYKLINNKIIAVFNKGDLASKEGILKLKNEINDFMI